MHRREGSLATWLAERKVWLVVGLVMSLIVLVTVSVYAAEYDLTSEGDWAVINGAVFRAYSPDNPTGTGIFPSFLRMNSNEGVEKGYNTDGDVEFDTTDSHTYALRLSDVPTVADPDVAGSFREFQLDVNQSGNEPLISLDQVEIYLTDDPEITGYDFGANASLIWDMDELDDNYVVLDYSHGAGSGKRDMVLRVPNDKFGSDADCVYGGGEDCTTFVVLFSEFGGVHPNNDGFEEWGTAIYEGKSGHKFHDMNANGIWDEGEPGLEGWTIFVDYNGNGLFDPATEPSDVTDAEGAYSIKVINAGTWTVYEVLQDDWYCSFPDPCYYEHEFEAGGSYPGNDFGNYTVTADTLFGYKWHDLDGDGVWDEGEPGLEGWEIHLEGMDNAGAPVSEVTWTDADGYYEFTVLPGLYDINEVCPAGEAWMQSYPAPTDGCGSGWHTGVGLGGPYHFGNFQNATKTGAKFHDMNANGTWDEGEPGLPGWEIHLAGSDGMGAPVSLVKVTDDNGYYEFSAPPGVYDIYEVCTGDWVQTYPAPTDGCGSGIYDDEVFASGQTYAGNDFGNYETPPFVPEASTLVLLGSGLTGLAGYVGLQVRARRRR